MSRHWEVFSSGADKFGVKVKPKLPKLDEAFPFHSYKESCFVGQLFLMYLFFSFSKDGLIDKNVMSQQTPIKLMLNTRNVEMLCPSV